MKQFSSLLLLILTIEYIQSKRILYRTYIIERDNRIEEKQLSTYTIYDSTGKNRLYQLKTTSTNIDSLILVNYPAMDIIANLEGEWIDKIFNVTFNIYDKKLNKWIDGIIRIDSSRATGDKYSIVWNSKHFNTKNKFWLSTLLYDTQQKEVVAESRKRHPWFNGGNVKFELKTYSNQFPDAIYFFVVAIDDHRLQVIISDD